MAGINTTNPYSRSTNLLHFTMDYQMCCCHNVMIEVKREPLGLALFFSLIPSV